MGKIKILDFNEFTAKKDNKKYYAVRIYISWSDVLITAFCKDSTVYQMIVSGDINDANIADYLSFSYVKGKLSATISM